MDKAQIAQVIDKLAQAKLLRLTPNSAHDEEQIELAHETLIDNWPRYQSWLEAEQLTRYKRLRLAKDTQDWQVQERSPDFLWRGQMLQEAKNYQNLNALESEFLKASENALEAGRRHQETFSRRLESLTQELKAVRSREQSWQEELKSVQSSAKLQVQTLQERLHSLEASARLQEKTLQERVKSLEVSLKMQKETLRKESSSLKASSIEALSYKQKYQRSLAAAALLLLSTVATITFAVIQSQNSTPPSTQDLSGILQNGKFLG